jgi:hypothetical protein
MMRKTATLMVLILSASLSAGARRKSEDTFKWISDHVQTVSYKVTTPLATYVEDHTAKVEFSGCNAKVTEDLKSHKIDIQTTISFELKDIQPDMIQIRSEKGVGDTQVTEYFVIQLPLVNSATSNTIFRTSGGSRTDSSASNSVSIVLPDRETAEGQASAWRDASRSCGAIDSISASSVAGAPSFGQR